METIEKERCGEVVTDLRLDRLHNKGCHCICCLYDGLFSLSQTSLPLGTVVSFVFLQWIFKLGKGCRRPVKRRHIKFLNSLTPCRGEAAKEMPVKPPLRRENGVILGARCLVPHYGIYLVFGERSKSTTKFVIQEAIQVAIK